MSSKLKPQVSHRSARLPIRLRLPAPETAAAETAASDETEAPQNAEETEETPLNTEQ